ncbi:MAG TPA: HAD hydrolase-like protein, partial [Gemmataceae bacterium]|nr:HAD hydrolase-like protein [Gemmataceae bacterium]
MRRRYQLLLWDFDGTLADTFALAVQTYNELAESYGFRPIPDPQSARRLTLRQFLTQYEVSIRKLPGFIRHFLRRQRLHAADVRLFPELPAILHTARDAGLTLGILSSNSQANIQACLQANGVAELFDFVMGYARLLGKVPGIRQVLRRQHRAPADLLYIGDEARDVEAARKAAVDSAAVTWGFHAPEVLARAKPTYLVATAGALWQVLCPG